MTLSAWAAAKTHRALSATTDDTARLAIAISSVKGIVRVVDRTVPPMVVQWSRATSDNEGGAIKSLSYTDFMAHTININPAPILDSKFDHGAALDICFGFGLHEASHSMHSRDRYKVLIKPNPDPEKAQHRQFDVPAVEPMRVAVYLWNVVEDVRCERITTLDWPGFEPYFGAVLDWVWGQVEKDELPTEYGPALKEKLQVAFLACRLPGKVDPAPFGGEFEWWQEWQADYLSDRVDTKTTILRALAHLGEDEATGKELQEMVEEERKERERGEKIRAQIDRLMREGIPGTFGVCITHDGEVTILDADTAAEVDQLVREGLIETRVVVTAKGAANPPIRVRKPEETHYSRRAYIGRPDAASAALRTALVFRNSAPEHDLKLLKAGDLDDEELYRWGMGDYRVFSEHVVESKPDAFMGLLVDISGSMRGEKLKTAQNLAQLFAWALHDQEGAATEVWAHTADTDRGTADVFRIWEQGDPLSRLGLLDTLPHSNNADGHALAYVVKQVMERPEPQRLVVVLSDGLPSATGYGGPPAFAHIRSVVRWAASNGVTVLQLAIDPYDLRPAEQEQMYGPGNWIGYRDVESLPRQLTQVMARFS